MVEAAVGMGLLAELERMERLVVLAETVLTFRLGQAQVVQTTSPQVVAVAVLAREVRLALAVSQE
jgi:hypothetical protein